MPTMTATTNMEGSSLIPKIRERRHTVWAQAQVIETLQTNLKRMANIGRSQLRGLNAPQSPGFAVKPSDRTLINFKGFI